jgi:hypothetical protein
LRRCDGGDLIQQAAERLFSSDIILSYILSTYPTKPNTKLHNNFQIINMPKLTGKDVGKVGFGLMGTHHMRRLCVRILTAKQA